MGAWKLAAPLAAGCYVILKPSALMPLSTLRLATILNDSLPAGIINIVHRTSTDVGHHLMRALHQQIFHSVATMKISGTGCDMSVYALDAYTNVRHVMVSH